MSWRHLYAGLALCAGLLASAGCGCTKSCCRPSCAPPVVSAAPPCCPGPASVAAPVPVQAYSPPPGAVLNGGHH